MPTFAEIDEFLAPDLARVLAVFDEELHSEKPFLNGLLERIHQYRGKLLRPRLLLLVGRACEGLRQEHLVLAAVVEMVHMATLVHDDVLDEADIRRRSHTINHAWGNQAAVLLGDYLISHAYHLCSSLGAATASRRIAAATNVVCEGEMMQIALRGRFDLDESAYLDIIRRKTAALTGVSCELGAWAAGAAPSVVKSLAAFGDDLGAAFQIVDDLLDLTSSEHELGKTVGRDADLRKVTLPVIRFLATASGPDRERLLAVLASDRENIASQVRETIADSDGIEYALAAARRLVESAVHHLSCLPPSYAREALTTLAEFVLQRRQ